MIDLSGVTEQILVDLTNVGTVRRATKELDRVRLTFTESPRGWVVTGDDDSRCLITTGAFADWECDCPAAARCRHLVRAVLAWQRDHSSAAAADTVPPEGAPEPTPEPTPEPAPQSRAARAAVARRERTGLVALVTYGPRIVVHLHVPEQAVVRFGATPDARFARCSCGESSCAHVADAVAACEAADGTSGVVDVGTPAVEVPAALRAGWEHWWAQVCDHGLGAAAELIGGAGRLAARMGDAGLWAPAAVMREIADQLGHQVSHDVQLDPDRLVELVGEVEARLRFLERPERDGVRFVPDLFVAGHHGSEQRMSNTRVVGLGAEYLYVGGWGRLQSYLADARTGQVFTVTVEGLAGTGTGTGAGAGTGTGTVEPLSERLARRGHASVRFGEWACSGGLLTATRVHGSELRMLRGARASLARVTRLDLPDHSPVRADTFADLDSFIDIPAPLTPRAHTDGVSAARVAQVSEVSVRTDGALRAVLTDADGGTALAVLPAAPPEVWPARRRLVDVLEGGEVSDVAGRWVRRGAGLVVRPTAVWSADGVTLSDLLDPAAARGTATPSAAVAARHDAWAALVAGVTDVVGRLMVAGAVRGGGAAQSFAGLADQAASCGLTQWAAALQRAADGVDDPARRSVALADVAVLVVFAG